MAQDLEQLVLSISADTRQMQRALAKLTSDTAKETRNIQRHFDTMGKGIGRSLSGVASTVRGGLASIGAGIGLREAQQLVDSATRIQNALKVAGLEGEALTRVYDRLFDSAQRNAAPLESLVELYGRASQNAKDLGASQEELLKFTDAVSVALRVNGKSAEESSGALLQLSQLLGSGTVRAEEFNSVQEGALPILQAVAAGLKEAGGSVSTLRNLVIEGKVTSEAFFRAFEAGAPILEQKLAGSTLTVDQALQRLRNSLTDAAGKMDGVTGASRTAVNLLDRLAGAVNGLSNVFEAAANSSIGKFIDKLSTLNDLILKFMPVYSALGLLDEKVLNGIAGGLGPSVGPANVRVAGGKGGRVVQDPVQSRIDSAFGDGSVTPVSLNDFKAPSSKSKTAKAPRKTADDRFSESVQSIKDRTAALREEQAALGLTFEQQEKRRVALQLEQEALALVREEARRKGEADWQNAKLTPDQLKAIDRVSEAYARQAEELRKATEAQELQRDILKGVFGDLRSALEDGKVNWEEFGNIALNVLDKIVSKIEDELIDALLKVNNLGGGGLLGLLFGGGNAFPAAPSGGGASSGVGLYHSGGVAGSPRSRRMVSPSIFANAPRYHSGTLNAGEVPAILQRGEIVIPRGRARQMMGGGAPTVNIINQGQPVTTERQEFDGRKLDIYINSKVDERLARNTPKALQSGFGITPKVGRRF